MPWPIARAALEALPARTRSPVTISFSGGEPTLEWGTIERVVEHLDAQGRGASPGGRAFACHLTTNGLLIDRERLAFLARHDFSVDLSLDGVEPAQDARGAGTFERLDELLRGWRAGHPDHFRRRCRVALTVSRTGAPVLAESVRYLYGRGVPDILLQPAMGEAEWPAGELARLDGQLARVAEEAAQHRGATGQIPVAALRGHARRGRARRRWGCSAPLGQSLAVDVDGQVYPCVLAAPSYQRSEAREAAAPLACLALGDIRGGLGALRSAATACAESGLFAPKALQHSGHRACASCPHRAGCFVCPIGRTWGRSSSDRNAVPGFLCAFNGLLQGHGRRFRAAAGDEAANGSGRVLRWLFGRGRVTT